MAYLKPQAPLMNGADYIYPITTADQIILSDGSRLEKDGVLTGGASEEVQSKIDEVSSLVGNTAVSTQISTAIDALRQEILGGAW